MRRPIETAPKDGKTVILEDDVNGTYELARWSAQECAWVAKNGKPYNITPAYWHAMELASPLEGECNSSSRLQTDSILPNLGAAPQPIAVSTDAFPPPPPGTNSDPVRVVSFGKQIPHAKAHRSHAQHRFAASCGAAMVAAAVIGMYFRGDVVAYVTQQADRADELGVGSRSQGSTLEQPRMISLALNPTDSPGLGGQATVGRAPTQSRENHPRTDARERDLFNARQALAEAQERETQLKQTVDTARTELKQSLDKIAILENELAQARQHTVKRPLWPRQAHRIPQRRQKQKNPERFFGIGG
jgi:hypothetical protein